jgi:SanA protein
MRHYYKPILRYASIGLGFICVFILVTNLTFHIATKPYIFTDITKVPTTGVALIPGAAVFTDGSLSPIFKNRADIAITLYEAQKVSKILVSGDNSTLSHNEVNPVRIYLMNNGIPDSDIFLDHAGFDTYSSMYRARDIFGVTSVTVTTQPFHLSRAVFIGRHLGIDAYGFSDTIDNTRLSNYVREFFAKEKAFFDLLLYREPKFLGEKIPITGDGTLYP